MTADSEPALVAAIAAAVARHRVRKVPLAVLLAAAASVDRTAASMVGWRARVRIALESLRDDGSVQWPTTRFDRRGEPALPAYVRRPVPSRPAPAPAPPVVWHAELDWAGEAFDAGILGGAEQRALRQVNGWLARRRGIVVPLRERSLDIFGDEKTLERMVFGPLFTPGRLTLELLACEACWPPVDQHIFGPGAWLVVENYTTYVSISRRAAECGFDGRVVWGSGNQVATRLSALAAAGEEAPLLWYFGDIDAGGFRVARSAHTRAGELGLGELRAARALYGLALEHGTSRPVDATRRAGADTLGWAGRWVGGAVGEACVAVAKAGHRIVQETVGRELLGGYDIVGLLEHQTLRR